MIKQICSFGSTEVLVIRVKPTFIVQKGKEFLLILEGHSVGIFKGEYH